ncbi:Hypothetical protein LUCI_2764 [Lucifera butyrica]|uniref:Uncharacterized protein n=1 Tax=Lucifera butyrica TaxID=1351585 RepID=A0A498R943_9FIRM|nr:hypothetical protein [Lucifera butyrica]VBB07515.1 Hypothetical protein LUCI_2764 [Lucifera butyrica]
MATPQPIITTILADINAVVPNFSSLVSSYRLLVGAAEEIHRIPGVSEEIFQRSITRFDRCGTLIDIFLELLCCKITYSTEFLGLSCAPIDLFRLLLNRSDALDTPHHTAEQIVELEALRRALGLSGLDCSCFNSPLGGNCPPEQGHHFTYTPPPPPTPAPAPAPPSAEPGETEVESELELSRTDPEPVTGPPAEAEVNSDPPVPPKTTQESQPSPPRPVKLPPQSAQPGPSGPTGQQIKITYRDPRQEL